MAEGHPNEDLDNDNAAIAIRRLTRRSPERHSSRADRFVPSRALRTLMLAATCAFALPVAAYDLAQHEWRHRLIVIAAPSADDPLAEAQRQVVESRRPAIADRDLRVFELYEDAGRVDGRPLAAKDRAGLRRHFQIDEGARELLLVGKDGGVKRRASLDTDLREFFVQIDAMPMRRSEIRAKRAAGVPVTRP